MSTFLRHIPLALSSLILALFSLSNLLSDHALLAQGIWFLASLLLVLLTASLLANFQASREALTNPVPASTFASFFMALFVFAGKLTLSPVLKHSLWLVLLVLFYAYIVSFSRRFIRQKNLTTVYPSWFVVFVGPAISVISLPSSTFSGLGLAILMVSSLSFLILVPFISYRLFQKPLNQQEQPLLAILAAPLALLLTAYIKWSSNANGLLILGTLFFSQALFLFALLLFIQRTRRGFSPLFAAFAFPLVSSTTALKQSILTLEITWLNPLLQLETLFSSLIITFITGYFIKLILSAIPLPAKLKKLAERKLNKTSTNLS